MQAIAAIRRFFSELRRRKVIRVGLVYLIVGWLALQIADVTFEPLHLPDWALTLVIWLVALGLPIALALAWVLELTPQGLQRERPAEPAAPADPAPAAPPAAEPSIAVLPFDDMSPERDQDYFCEGMAEEVLNVLARIDGLRVAARTSTFQYKGKPVDVRAIGRTLGVATILEGSVRKQGDRLRVTVQLIDVADGYHLWTERYDRPLEDVFKIQDEIARSIAEALQPRLSLGEGDSAHVPVTNCRTYDYYLRGLQYFHRFGAKNLGYARRMFEQAIEIDADYAPAWAGLADTMALTYMQLDASEENCQIACDAARRAVELDPDSAEAHASRGMTEMLSHRYAQAEAEFDTAVRLNPRLYEAHYFYARCCVEQGKLECAAESYETASRLRPEDYQAPGLAVQVYRSLGRPEAAKDAARRTVNAAQRVLELNPDDARALYLGANALAELGESARAGAWADRALAVDPNDNAILYNVACFHALNGEHERALDIFERINLSGVANRRWMENDSTLDGLREHPRFEALLAKLK